jgi:REP element-mobilizing transposase RayT
MPGVIAAHIIVTAYGFWLPNDPRGSWSDFVASWELLKYGKATKVDTRKSVAHVPHDYKRRMEAKKALKYEPVIFTGVQARAVARGFAQAVAEGGYRILAGSILPDHVHLVVERHSRLFEQITQHLKARATRQLRAEGCHPFGEFERADGSVPCMWAGGLWKVYCDDVKHVENAKKYVQENPTREGKREQNWSFVSPLE